MERRRTDGERDALFQLSVRRLYQIDSDAEHGYDAQFWTVLTEPWCAPDQRAQFWGSCALMAVPSSTQCRQPNLRLPRSSSPKLRPPFSPEDLSCSPWRSVAAVPLPLMRQTHQ